MNVALFSLTVILALACLTLGSLLWAACSDLMAIRLDRKDDSDEFAKDLQRLESYYADLFRTTKEKRDTEIESLKAKHAEQLRAGYENEMIRVSELAEGNKSLIDSRDEWQRNFQALGQQLNEVKECHDEECEVHAATAETLNELVSVIKTNLEAKRPRNWKVILSDFVYPVIDS